MPDLSPTIDGRMVTLGTNWANTVGDGVTASGLNTTTGYWSAGIQVIDLLKYNLV